MDKLGVAIQSTQRHHAKDRTGASLRPVGGSTPSERSIDQLCIDTIRTLSMDAVEQAKSGHPGTPMALAPVAYTLWQRFLRFDPDDPIWPNRDRFVLVQWPCVHAALFNPTPH